MHFILCQPAIKRFKWELEVCLTNLKKFGVDDIILLFSKGDDSIPTFFEKKYGTRCFIYHDDRLDKSYIPSIKPYLWWQFLNDNPEMQHGEYFYMDADVIFRELPDFGKIDHGPYKWAGSDTESYLGPDYIESKGIGYLPSMGGIIGIDIDQAKQLKGHSAGAQWLITDPQAAYWKKVYEDSNRLYHYFNGAEHVEKQKHGKDYVTIQKWTAEMWAQLWNMPLFDIEPVIDHELDFLFATNPVENWDKAKIMHNAGITAAMKDCFFKGKYTQKSPFGEDFSYVNRSKCSYKYVQAIQEVNHG